MSIKITNTFSIFIVFILPIILIILGIIPFAYRFHVLISASLFPILHIFFLRTELDSVGFRIENTFRAIKNILPITLFLALPLIVVYFSGWQRIDNTSIGWPFYFFFILVSSPLQEFMCRGYLFYILEKFSLNKIFLIISSSLLYSFIHLIYFDLFTLISTFVIGLVWGVHYYKFRNIFSVTLSHAVLGVLAIASGLI